MPNAVDRYSPLNRASTLGRWIVQTLEPRGVHVKLRLRGNSLHILCQAAPCPDRLTLLAWLIPALQKTNLNTLVPVANPSIYRVQLYGCEPGARHPDWTALIHLNQLDRHLEQLQGVSNGRATSQAKGRGTALAELQANFVQEGALALSNRSLAKQGQEAAIASYLSETLGSLGIAVQVSAKTVPYTPPSTVRVGLNPLATLTTKRLWVACGAAYSPDPSLVGEPITQRLRELEIEGYRDAVILFQVAGEAQPDWRLRVDLTPPGEMLREWARWGDVEAIQRLLNQAGESQGMHITTASLKEATLHLFCSLRSQTEADAPDQTRSQRWVAGLLEPLAPQGIHAVALYGQAKGTEPPAWVEWLPLPAAIHPALSESALLLAQQSDWEAIAFLLHRLLNPSLDRYLTTGGVRLQILPKQDLLHVMSEASVCPDQHRVGQTIAKFLRQLKLSHLAGVRIYGRRSGQKLPLWSFGIDFVTRDRLVPEAAPEFVATDSFVHELVTPLHEPTYRPDLTPSDVRSVWQRFWQQRVHGVEQLLVRSHLFATSPQTQALAMAAPSPLTGIQLKTAAVWGTVGMLLMLQTNWLMGQVLRTSEAPKRQAAVDATVPVLSSTLPTESSEPPEPLSRSPLSQSPDKSGIFNSEGFTQPNNAKLAKPAAPASALPYSLPPSNSSEITASILAAEPMLASFNSHQLNEKLKLYYRYLQEQGSPPDVLIIGSSRALRGVDPAALQQALADLGYANISSFNFGINGATAQVADLLIRELLTPEQMPRLILWADGARAFNSGNTDVTFNGIAASEGYRQLLAGQFAIPQLSASASSPEAAPTGGINLSLTNGYESVDRWLSNQLAQASGTYEERDRLKHWFQQGFSQIMPTQAANAPEAPPQAAASQVNPAGFLPLAVQFNPATYYQKYAKVVGQYDSDYESFRIKGRQETALQSLLQVTQSRNVPIVFVNLPLTEDYLDPLRRRYNQAFKQYMVSLAMQQPGFTFRDLSEQWVAQYGYFSDPSHLNRYGAYAMSHKLAQDPLIPWFGKAKD